MKISKAELRRIIREEFERDSVLLESESHPKIDLYDPNTITSKWLLSVVSEIDEPTESESILLNALEDCGFPYETINSDQFDALHMKMDEIAESLAEMGKIKITDGTQYSRTYTKESKKNLSKIHNLDHLLPYAEKLCSLLPVICNASIQFFNPESDSGDRELDPSEVLFYGDDDFSTPITPELVVSFGDSPNSDYNNDILVFYEDFGRFGDDNEVNVKWLIQQSQLNSYDDVDERLKDYINEFLGHTRSPAQLKADYVVDVDLD